MPHRHRPIPDDFHPTFSDDPARGTLTYRDRLVTGEGPDRHEVHIETGLRYGVPTKSRAQALVQLRALAWSIHEHCRCGTHHTIAHHTKDRHPKTRPIGKPQITPEVEAELNTPIEA